MYKQNIAIVISTADGLATHIEQGNQVKVDASCSALKNNYNMFIAGGKTQSPPDDELAKTYETGLDAIYLASSECAGGFLSKPDYASARADARGGALLLNSVLDAAQNS